MDKIISKNLITLTIIFFLISVSLIKEFTSDIILTNKHYIGFTLIFLTVLLYFFYKKWFIYFLFYVLLAGCVDLIDIFYITINVKIIFVTFNPIFIILFILHLIFNKFMDNQLFP